MHKCRTIRSSNILSMKPNLLGSFVYLNINPVCQISFAIFCHHSVVCYRLYEIRFCSKMNYELQVSQSDETFLESHSSFVL